MSPETPVRHPHWYSIPARVLLVTLVCTLLVFAVSLFVGIVGTVGVSRLHGTRPDMTVAYHYIALPAAAVAGVIVLVLALAMEIRHYRQAKALDSISRAS
jgi:uncharacterized membrane protein